MNNIVSILKCNECDVCYIEPAYNKCTDIMHWKTYSQVLEERLELKDEDRDKFDVAQWLSNYEKVKSYNCTGCDRHYEIPTHINHFTCICGRMCRMRHLGGVNSNEAVIDAAIDYFGNEKMAQLAWIAEIIVFHAVDFYSTDEIKKMIQREIDKWELSDNGWKKK